MPKILYVGDDREFCDAAQQALAMAGYTVHAADSGAAALSTVVENLPDVILLDGSTADIDSEILCGYFGIGKSISVLLLIDRVDEPGGTHMCPGAVGHMTKPINLKRLVARLQDIAPLPNRMPRE